MHLHLGLEPYFAPFVYCTAIVVFLASLFYRPQIGLYFLLPLLPLQNLRYRIHELPFGEKLIDFILLGILLGLMFRGQEIFKSTPLNKLLLVLAVFTYLWLWKGSFSASLPLPVWFDNLRVSNWKNNVVVPIVLFFAVISAITTTKRMRILILFMCLGIILLNRNVRNETGGRDYSAFSYQTRVNAGGLNSNSLASLEAQFCFLLLVLQSFEKNRLLKVAYLGVAAFCVYSLIYTFSRGGYVAFLAGWLFLGIVKEKKLLIALVLFLSAWQVLVPNAVRDRVLMTYSADEGLEHSAAGRLTLWQDAVEAVRQNPLVGRGYDTYFYEGSHVEGLRDTHNLYLKILYETGGLGLFLFLALLWKAYQLGYSLYRSSPDPFLASLGLGLATWMICVFVGNLFGDRWNFIQLLGYTWTLIAMVMRGHMIQQQPENELEISEAPVAAKPAESWA